LTDALADVYSRIAIAAACRHGESKKPHGYLHTGALTAIVLPREARGLFVDRDSLK